LNLLVPLQDVGLIDADGIRPETALTILQAKISKGIGEIPTDFKTGSAHQDGFPIALIAPGV
jgi:hypothetical protein